MTDDRCSFELHFANLDVPDGEIALDDLARIAESLQELALRVGRDLDDATGPGRTRKSVGTQIRITLSELSPGSTRVRMSGTSTVPEFDLGPAGENFTTRVFTEITRVIERPQSARSRLVAESANRFSRALHDTGDCEITFRAPNRPDERFAPAAPSNAPPTDAGTRSRGSVTGILYQVDAHTGRFRIEDAIGTSINLKLTGDIETSARLVTFQVVATGVIERDDRGRISMVSDATVARLEPDETPLNDVEGDNPANIPPFDGTRGGIPGLSDDEFDEFLRAARS